MTRAAAHAHPLQDIALILAAAACFAGLDSSTRALTQSTGRWQMPVLAALASRYTLQALVMAAWLAPRGRAGFAAAHPRFQALRGGLLLATSLCSFFGVSLMPVPEYTAINMITPLLVTVLAAVVLRERVSAPRWLLVAGGFAGALVVIRPGSGAFGWVVALPVLGAVAYASFQVLTSHLSGAEDPLTTHFYTGFVGAACLLPALAAATAVQGLAWTARMDATGWALLALGGLLGTAGHLLLILALGRARTATLMPFVYTQIGFAALIGVLAFGHRPDRWAIVGMAVIAACGATSAALNLRRPGAAAPAAAVDIAPE